MLFLVLVIEVRYVKCGLVSATMTRLCILLPYYDNLEYRLFVLLHRCGMERSEESVELNTLVKFLCLLSSWSL